jgi:hypothetical protein
VQRHFADQVSPEQARVLAEVFRGITTNLEDGPPP